jgi:hypothetical protein
MNILSLSRASQDFVTALSFNNKAKSCYVSIVLAKCLIDRTSIPTIKAIVPVYENVVLKNTLMAPVCQADNGAMYFKTNIELDITRKLSYLNECVCIDIKAIIDYAQKFYLARLAIIYPLKTIRIASAQTAIVDFFQISQAIDGATLKEITDHETEIALLYNSATRFFNENIPASSALI